MTELPPSDSGPSPLPDYGLRQDDSWILDSPAQRILREDSDPPAFSALLAKYHHNSPEQSRRLHSICTRLEFVEQLNHSLSVRTAQHRRLEYQTSRLVTHLTLTCLDIVAARTASFQEFPHWLSSQLKRSPNEWPHSIRDAIRQVVDASQDAVSLRHRLLRPRPHADLTSTAGTTLSAGLVAAYNKDYLPNFGMRRGFGWLITTAIPDWLKTWLADTFFIVKGDIIPIVLDDAPSLDWLNMSLEQRLARIADYLYQARNVYTHSVRHHPAMDIEGIFRLPIRGTNYRFAFIDRTDDIPSPVEWSIGLKEGLPESEVIRLIIVVELRRRIGIEDSSPLIETFSFRAQYRRLAYRFLSELAFNKAVLLAWGRARVLDSWLDYSEALQSSLSLEHMDNYIRCQSRSTRYRGIRLENGPDYAQAINSLNREIDTLRRTAAALSPWQASHLCASSLQGILDLDATRLIMRTIQAYENLLEQVLHTPFY